MDRIVSRVFLGLIFVCLSLTSCTGGHDKPKETLSLKPSTFDALDGWEKDHHAAALKAFQVSCTRILKREDSAFFGPDPWAGTYKDWKNLCSKAQKTALVDVKARAFFEQNFKPYAAFSNGKREGLFTGYYEASLNGSYKRHGPYQFPLYARPDDLVMVDLGAFREDLRGRRIAGRVLNGQLKPYETREMIEQQKKGKPLLWVDSPVDAFFLHIQGSGRVALDTGGAVRVGYAGQNGHPYYAIGRALVKRGYLKKEDVTMQSIRDWLEKNPDQATEIMNTNQSYVFFDILDNKKGSFDGPLGGEGLPLTPMRSLAVDRALIPYGLPLWLETQDPDLKRLMVAQDTGGAIRGPVRGDVFFGYGNEAEERAGKMKAQGQYWFLLPAFQ